MSCGAHCDAFVIGGGPAGATAARLLASWGWKVRAAHRAARDQPALAESLPAGTRKLLSFLGQLSAIDAASFHPNHGNVGRWAGMSRDTRTPDAGFHVERRSFDALLRREAAASGARVLDAVVRRLVLADPNSVEYVGADGTRHTCTASFVLDCSGRAGIAARQGFRRAGAGYRTLAVAAEWECPQWPADEHTRTLVNSYDDGWAWSVPLSATRRQCTVMVEAAAHASTLQDVYAREMAKAREMARRLTGARQIARSWACSASVYSAPDPAARGVLLVGDAASFIEPLSSAGVQKAMTSAWRAAVVVNTCLKHAAMTTTAMDFYAERERQVFAECQRVSHQFFAEAAAAHGSAFWEARAQAAGAAPTAAAADSADLRRAFDRLRSAPGLRLRAAPALRFGSLPDIEGREVVLREGVVMPGDSQLVRFAAGVNLPALVRLASECREVPALFSAYTTHVGAVPIDGLLTGLSLLVAREALISEDCRS